MLKIFLMKINNNTIISHYVLRVTLFQIGKFSFAHNLNVRSNPEEAINPLSKGK